MLERLLINFADHTQRPRVSIRDGRYSFRCLSGHNSTHDSHSHRALSCEAAIEEMALG